MMTFQPDATPFDVVHVAYSPFPADPRVRREITALANAGYRTAVIALAELHHAGEDRWNGTTVFRISGRKRRGTFGQYVSEYGGFLRAARRLIASDARLLGTRVVHAHSLPDFLVYAAGPAKRRGAAVVLDLHEILPEFARAKFGGLAGRVAETIGRAIERRARNYAHATITVNRPIHALLRSRAPRSDERLVVLHNVPDPSDFGPRRTPALRDSERLRLVYHGTLTPVYGLDLAIDAVVAARARGIDVSLDIYGDGPQKSALARQVEASDAGCFVVQNAPVSAAELRRLLPTFDAGLVPTRGNEMTRYSLSTKLLEYIHLGIPALAPSLETYKRYFPVGALYYFTGNDRGSLRDAIVRLTATPRAEREATASRAQEILSGLSWDQERQKLLALYDELLGPPH